MNIILMIGDGMGISQVHAGLTVNHGILNLMQFRSIGFSKTSSSSHYTTDSAAGGTAISTGVKTFNGAIGVGRDSLPRKTILEYAEEYGVDSLVAMSLVYKQDILRKELEIPDYLTIVIGIALGYANPDSIINTYRSPRRPVQEVVRYKK